ncbi:Translation initiation factor 1A [Clydaea vesicula]|uniref:Eukaryotic translation initiation factor 4C n=1 Tax=Clydaea vesicula TaxID=447962 RepID=A0AAD5UAI6_9FUNG|nr:Translation initiation factor 1A [Clydaea vesicula]KAJ3394657.1 Translation initiation factor 1A [Lobulomyces angularis]
MPKNKGKGGKNRKKGKNENDSDKRELVFKEDGQEYATVTKLLGNGWVQTQCCDGEARMARIRGAMIRRVWITTGDLILLGLRDYQDSKADVLMKYTADEARMLKSYGELPDNLKINEDEVNNEGGDETGVEIEFNIDEI